MLADNSSGANNTTYAPNVIQLGGFSTGAEMTKGEVASVLLYDRILEEDELYSIQASLNDKYGSGIWPQVPEVPRTTFALVAGEGDSDNAAFIIDGNE